MGWTDDKAILEETSQSPVGMATLNGTLYLAHIGKTYYDIYILSTAGGDWSKIAKPEGLTSFYGPAMASFDNKLVMVGYDNVSVSPDEAYPRMWYSQSSDGKNWTSPDTVFLDNGFSRNSSPALAAFSNMVWLVYTDVNNNLHYATFNGTGWSSAKDVPGQTTNRAPALSVLGDVLYLAHTGSNSDTIYVVTCGPNGIWSTSTLQTPMTSKAGPSVAACLGNLYLSHVGQSSSSIYFSEFNDHTNNWGSDSPALKDSNGKEKTSNQTPAICTLNNVLYMVHTGPSYENLYYSKYTP
jgi:hypothetical protein